MKELIRVALHDYTVILRFDPFNEEIDIDDLTKIHYENLSGEIITTSTVLNRIGLLKAEAENVVNKNKHLLEVLGANKRKHYRKLAIEESKKLTMQGLEDKVLLDEEYQREKLSYIDDKRVLQILESLYWAINSKDKKLSVLMSGITPQEFEKDIIEGKINGVMVKKIENPIK